MPVLRRKEKRTAGTCASNVPCIVQLFGLTATANDDTVALVELHADLAVDALL